MHDREAPQSSQWSFPVLAEAIKDPEVIWSSHREGSDEIVDFVYEYVNAAAAATIGVPAADLLGRRLLEVLPAHRDLGLFDRYRAVAETGVAEVIEIPWFEDGNVAGAFEASVSVMGDGIVSVARDVTDRVLAEQRLLASEKRHRALVSELPIPVWINGPDGVIVANSATAALVGVDDPAALVGQKLYQYLDPESFDPGDRLRHFAEDSEETQSFGVIGRLPSGRRHVQMYRRVVEFEGDVVAMWAAIDTTDRVVAEAELSASETRLRTVIDNGSDLINIVDRDGTIQFTSPSCQTILGRRPGALVGRRIHELVHPNDQHGAFNQALRSNDEGPVRVRAAHADGSMRWLETVARPLPASPSGQTTFLLSSRDVTARIEAENRLRHERELLDATFASVHAGVIAVAADGRIINVNDQFRKLTGATVRAGENLFDLTYDYLICGPDDTELAEHERPLELALQGCDVVDMTLFLHRSDGSCLELEASATAIATADETAGAVLTLHDVTDLRNAEREMRHLATVDPLTQLPNRRAIEAHLTAALARNRRTPDRLTVLFLDLDGFKSVNDSLGHSGGDQLLVAVAERLKAVTRDGDLIGRFGGDEFIAILECNGVHVPEHLARRIIEALDEPFVLSAGVANIGVSIGSTTAVGHETAEAILATADRAMYQTKRHSGLRRSSHPVGPADR